MDFEFNPLDWGDNIKSAAKSAGSFAWSSLPGDNFTKVFNTAIEAYDPYRPGFWDRVRRNEVVLSEEEKRKALKTMALQTTQGLAEAGVAGLGGSAGISAAKAAGTSGFGRLTLAALKGMFAPGKVPGTNFPGPAPVLKESPRNVLKGVAMVAGPVGPLGAAVVNAGSGLIDRVFGSSKADAAKQQPLKEEIIPFGAAPKPFSKPAAEAADMRRWEELGKAGIFPNGEASAADFRKFEEATKAPTTTTTQTSVGDVTVRPVEIEPIRPPATAEAPVIKPPKLAEPGAAGSLSPLTPEQIKALALQERELQSQYDAVLNALTLQETQARQAESAARGAARREAVGSRQDFATQLAAAGLDASPAPAIAVGQITGSRQQAQEIAAARTLLDILAQAEAQRIGAKTQLAQGKTGVERARIEQQTANTLADQLRLYEQLGGL